MVVSVPMIEVQNPHAPEDPKTLKPLTYCNRLTRPPFQVASNPNWGKSGYRILEYFWDCQCKETNLVPATVSS